MIRGARAMASEGAAAAAAQAIVEAGGGAVDAVIAGFFGAAGARPGVLFAPVVALCGGFGAGGRAFDGRPAQPGRGAPRPRGFVTPADIPLAARIAAPRSIATLVLLSGHRGRTPLAELAKAGVAAAESAGRKERARLIRRVGASGVLALRAPEVQAALLAAGGPVAGGTLTAEDLEEAAPTETEARATVLDEGTATALTIYTPPFPPPGDGDAEVVVACDGRGVIAALAYSPALDGVEVPALEVTLGLHGVPVRRGVPRVTPGTVLPAPAPIAIAGQSGGFSLAVGASGRTRLEPASVAGLARGPALEAALAVLREEVGGRAAAAIVTDGNAARGALATG